jgi:hypothetical protein
MQSIDNYYYKNEIDVQFHFDPTIKLRNRVLYQRPIKLYKGIDNQVHFNIKNADQQPVNITGFDLTFNMLADNEGTILKSTPITVVNANVGSTTVSLNELDLMDCDQEFYYYSILATEQVSGIQHIIYSNNDYGARGEIIVQDGHYPKFRPSIHVQMPTSSANTTITSVVTSDTPTRQQSTHHTAEFIFDNFTGNIDVQVTLDILPTNGNVSTNSSVSWATLSSLTYQDQVVPDYITWEGIYTGCRFVISPEPPCLSSNVTDIWYRS